MLHWTIWGREPGFHEASLRRYGSKLVYHITVYFLFTLVTVTCKYSILTQLTYHFASYNSCSNWRPPISMQAWHRRTRFCRFLINIPGVFWITDFTDPRFHTSNCSVIQNTSGIFVRVRQNLVRRCHACIEIGGRQFEQLSCDGASGVVGRHPCYSLTYNIGASSLLIPRPDPVLDTSWGYLRCKMIR